MSDNPTAAEGRPQPTERDFKQRLAHIYAELVEVRVVTMVGNVSVTVNRDGPAYRTELAIPDDGATTDALVTIFDLIDGDVTNIIAPALRDDAELRAYHSAQVEKSLSVLPDNLRLIVDLGRRIMDELSGGGGR